MHVLFLVFIFGRISRNVRRLVFWFGFSISCAFFFCIDAAYIQLLLTLILIGSVRELERSLV